MRVLFVCIGNICRSTMAEFVLKHLVETRGLSDKFHVESAGTSAEVDSPVYPMTRNKLTSQNISYNPEKRSRQLLKKDYDDFDYIICMDKSNIASATQIFGGDPQKKLSLMLDFTTRGGDIADPWYTRNFDQTFIDIKEGCLGFLGQLGYW